MHPTSILRPGNPPAKEEVKEGVKEVKEVNGEKEAKVEEKEAGEWIQPISPGFL
jgi:hypothetical protein